MTEQALRFQCDGEWLAGILHPGADAADTGVLLVVGGPQTRVGSHRQFTLLARHVAGQGVPVLRFDYRGMGDSGGRLRDFEDVGEDIRLAIDKLVELQPGVRRVVIWGLCDAASAAAFYAAGDERVKGLVLLNPWVRTESGEAKAYLKHYYLQRLMQGEFWRKLFSGRFSFRDSAAGLWSAVQKALGRGDGAAEPAEDTKATDDAPPPAANGPSLPERMADGLEAFRGQVLLIISGNDLTAAEFLDTVAQSRRWKRILARKQWQRRDLNEADHTFSTRAWRDQVADWTADWLRGLR